MEMVDVQQRPNHLDNKDIVWIYNDIQKAVDFVNHEML
jgi:hypothetical protein